MIKRHLNLFDCMLKSVIPTAVDTFSDEKLWLPSIDN